MPFLFCGPGRAIYPIDSKTIEITAVIMPIIPSVLTFSPKITTPIAIVVSKLNTDHIVPTMEREFFCKIAGSHANTPKE